VDPTPEHQALIDVIARVLAADADVEAAWLAGSLGRGAGDAFSDVDVLALCGEGRADGVAARWLHGCAAVAEPVLVNPLFGGRIVNVVTADWQRFDVVFIEAANLERYDAAVLKALFNKGELSPRTRAAAPYQPKPEAATALVSEFLRILGMLPGAIGRGEHMLGLTGLELLRRMTMDLMLMENGVGPAELGGALRRNPFLKPDQIAELEGLAPVAATRDGLIAANLELAPLFLARARRLAAELGAEWPLKLEDATRRHLERTLGARWT
jgi:predicted nucleotidyltransferase